MDLTAPSLVKNLMERYKFRCRKSLGQNFLVDANIVNKIVDAACVTENDTVLEIGPGLGVLTRAAAQKAAKVLAVEVDRGLVPILGDTLADLKNVQLVQGDALSIDFNRLLQQNGGAAGAPGEFKILANLPYYITTPLIMHILKSKFNFSLMVIMIQQEVAARLKAAPGGKDYGSLTVAVRYHTEVEYLFKVPRTVFIPRPEVDSAVVRLTRRAKPAVEVPDPDLLFRVVRGAFGQRRKTLLNALGSAFTDISRGSLEEILTSAGINPGRRGETLSLEEFASVSCKLRQIILAGGCGQLPEDRSRTPGSGEQGF